MAGLGSRFTEKGINVPKPLIKVSGKYMIEWALKNIQGMTAEDILMTFYEKITFKRDKFGWSSNLDLSFHRI